MLRNEDLNGIVSSAVETSDEIMDRRNVQT